MKLREEFTFTYMYLIEVEKTENWIEEKGEQKQNRMEITKRWGDNNQKRRKLD